MAREALTRITIALLLVAALTPAATGAWPAQPQCEDEQTGGVRVRACVGGSICQSVGGGGQTQVIVCVDPSVCPDLGNLQAPEEICRPHRVDNDGDGYTPDEGDCNDNDPMTFPGAPDDSPDGADNDCDGMVDEDMDNDGDGWTVSAGDCDDWNYGINPAATETPGNGVDEDCDGLD